MKLGLLWEAIRRFRQGAPLGDVVVLKFAALRETPPALLGKLNDVRGFAPELSFEALDRLPEGSFGWAYARFLRQNELEHLVISAQTLKRLATNPFAIRYTVTHDLHHVLTGFDTGISGEVGVLGFTVGQGTALVGRAGLALLRVLYPLLAPRQAAAIRHNLELGREMGRRARLLLAEPLESLLAEPFDDVRVRLGISADDVALVRPSKRSWLAERALAMRGRPAELPPANP